MPLVSVSLNKDVLSSPDAMTNGNVNFSPCDLELSVHSLFNGNKAPLYYDCLYHQCTRINKHGSWARIILVWVQHIEMDRLEQPYLAV